MLQNIKYFKCIIDALGVENWITSIFIKNFFLLHMYICKVTFLKRNFYWKCQVSAKGAFVNIYFISGDKMWI